MPNAVNPALDLLEKDLQKQIRAMCKQFGWTVTVTWSSMNSPKGWPDIFAVRPRFTNPLVSEAVAIECKREPKHCANNAVKGVIDGVTPEQRHWLELLAALPGVKFAGVIRPSDWYAGKLDEVLR